MVSILALLAVALACAIDLTVFVVQLLTAGARRTPWHLAVIAGLALLVIVAARADLPVKLRFAASRSAFDTYAERVLAESSLHDDPPLPDRLGSFEVRYARVLPEGVIIFDVHGSGSNDAGFAHLPDGDLPAGDGNFESPQFRPLGGGWYAFTSGW